MNEGIDSSRKALTSPSEAKPTQLTPNYQFTQDEMRVLAECNTESFYQRSLPFCGIFSTLTYFGVQKGYLKPNPRFGAKPKIGLAVVFGYFLGKVSYQQICAEKLMQLPDSYVGELLRKRNNREPSGSGSSLSLFGAASPDVYSDASRGAMGSSLDLDTDRPVFQGLAENKKPNLDMGASPSEESLAPKSPSMTYEELRRKNREEQTSSRVQPYKLEEYTPQPRTRVEHVPKNKYGDDIN